MFPYGLEFIFHLQFGTRAHQLIDPTPLYLGREKNWTKLKSNPGLQLSKKANYYFIVFKLDNVHLTLHFKQ